MSRFLDPPKAGKPLAEDKVDKTYKAMRTKVFLGAFFGYAAYYLVRKNLSLAAPALQKTLIYIALCLIGFFIYGPVALTGVQALNLVPKNAAGTAAGFVGLFGYLLGDAVCSKILVGGIAVGSSWDTAMLSVAVGALIGVFLCALLIRSERNLAKSNA